MNDISCAYADSIPLQKSPTLALVFSEILYLGLDCLDSMEGLFKPFTQCVNHELVQTFPPTSFSTITLLCECECECNKTHFATELGRMSHSQSSKFGIQKVFSPFQTGTSSRILEEY